MAGLPYLIGNYVDDRSMTGLPSFFLNCEKYAHNDLQRTNANLGFVKYPGRTWDVCYVTDIGPNKNGTHWMRKDANGEGTWSQRECDTITNCFCYHGTVDTTKKITDSNLQQAFAYAGFNGNVSFSPYTQK